jgi:spore coat protein A
VTDKSFKTNGQLYYPTTSPIPGYSSWVPEFYGNTMLVNGEVWPKMTLKKGKFRFLLLNACQNRYLNIYFENMGKKIPIELLRVDGDYYDTQIVVSELFATIASRIEFILDLTYTQG